MKKIILIALVIAVATLIVGCGAIKTILEEASENPDDIAYAESITRGGNLSIQEMFDEFESFNWSISMKSIEKVTNSTSLKDESSPNLLFVETSKYSINDCELNKTYIFSENNKNELKQYIYNFEYRAFYEKNYTDLYDEIRREIKSRYGDFVYNKKSEGEKGTITGGMSILHCFSKTDYGFIDVAILGSSGNDDSISIAFYAKDSAEGNLQYELLSKAGKENPELDDNDFEKTPEPVQMPELKTELSMEELFDELENANWNLPEDVVVAATNIQPAQHESVPKAEAVTIPGFKIDNCEMTKDYLYIKDSPETLDSYYYYLEFKNSERKKYTNLYNKIKKEMKKRYGELLLDKNYDENGVSLSQCFVKTDNGVVFLEIIKSSLGNGIDIIVHSDDSIYGKLLYKEISENQK